MISIRDLLNKGGSPTGVSYFMKRAVCPQKALLDKQVREEGGEPVEESRDAGTVFHKLAELHHGGLDVNEVPRAQEVESQYFGIVSEAWRLFDWYRGYAPRDYWGEVLGCEIPLDWPRPDVPGNYTGSVDMAVQVGPDHWVAREYNGPGVYILDWKTHKQKPAEIHMKDAYSLQFAGYQYLWHKRKGVWPQGVLAHHLVRHVKLELGKSSLTTFTPRPCENDLRALFSFFTRAEKLPDDFANVSQCFNYNKPCAHLISGRCSRGA